MALDLTWLVGAAEATQERAAGLNGWHFHGTDEVLGSGDGLMGVTSSLASKRKGMGKKCGGEESGRLASSAVHISLFKARIEVGAGEQRQPLQDT